MSATRQCRARHKIASASQLAAFVAAVAVAGYFAALLVFFVVFLKTMAKASWVKTIVLTLAAAIFMMVLARSLNLVMPAGFLQGQFRDSALEYEYNALHPVIGEAWFGVTAQLSKHYRLSWVVRYQSSEIKSGIGDREVFWGRITLSRAL